MSGTELVLEIDVTGIASVLPDTVAVDDLTFGQLPASTGVPVLGWTRVVFALALAFAGVAARNRARRERFGVQ